MKLTVLFLAVFGCSSLTGACGDDAESFSIVADQITGGVFLGASSDGEEAIFVGGQLGGGPGIIAHYNDAGLCIEEGASDRALWWIHSARPGEWYAVGEAGTIIHSVGGVRTVESVATDAIFYGVWDSGDRVIAVGGDVRGTGEGEVWVRNAGTWSLLAGGLPGVVFKVWNQWMVGKDVAYHLEGDTLVERFPPENTSLLTVVGRDDNDVWAVGGLTTPTVLHWNGSDWDSVQVAPECAGNNGLNGVWTAPGEELWVGGFFGTMASNDGDTWSCPKEPPTYEHFHVVVKHGEEVLWGGGNLFNAGNNFGTIGRYGKGKRALVPTICD
jgi:hypothetical protein